MAGPGYEVWLQVRLLLLWGSRGLRSNRNSYKEGNRFRLQPRNIKEHPRNLQCVGRQAAVSCWRSTCFDHKCVQDGRSLKDLCSLGCKLIWEHNSHTLCREHWGNRGCSGFRFNTNNNTCNRSCWNNNSKARYLHNLQDGRRKRRRRCINRRRNSYPVYARRNERSVHSSPE